MTLFSRDEVQLERFLEALLDAGTRKPAPSVRLPRFILVFGQYRFAAVSALLIVSVIIGVIAYRNYGPRASWLVTRLAGAPKVGGSTVKDESRIRVGDALVTDGSSRAEISVGAVGKVEVEPNSRIRLVEAEVTEHRLALDRGKMKARIYAPPKLFFVDTPSAEAIDLGCAYTLEVDDAGRAFRCAARVRRRAGGAGCHDPACRDALDGLGRADP